MKTKLKPLQPPDMLQCQAEHQVGAFQIGGRIGERTRCTNKPAVVARETRPGPDGRIGSMSLCEECRQAAERILGDGVAFEPLQGPFEVPS